MSRKFLIIILIIFFVLIILSGIGIFAALYIISNFGECPLGEKKYFENTPCEICARIGTDVDCPSTAERSLKIIRQPWSGWDEKQPEESTQWVDIANVNQEIELEGIGSDDMYILKVVSYNDDEIVLQRNGLGIKIGEEINSPGIDLNSCTTSNFTIEIEETIELYTCTMDVGVNWEITYYSETMD